MQKGILSGKVAIVFFACSLSFAGLAAAADTGDLVEQKTGGGIGSPSDRTYTDPVTGMEFVWVEGGCFQMGSPSSESERETDEGPVHEVCVDGFYMGRYEVTNHEYRMYKSGHNSKDYKGNTLNNDKQPAVYVSWDDALEFADWLTSKSGKKFRLPTEAEWEYAARGGTSTARYWGNDPDDACGSANVADQSAKRKWSNLTIHNCDDGYAVTSPVGSFKPNGFGLYDMLGNVWEWVNDWCGDYYSQSPRDNPQGPSFGSDRVLRGGSWDDEPGDVRAAIRNWVSPGYRDDILGFRLAVPAR